MKSKERTFTHKMKDKLLTAMARKGLNGQKLAMISKVSDSEISRILSGQSTPGLENAYRLARAVNVSLDFLADDQLEVDPITSSDPLSIEERRLLDLAQRVGLVRAVLLLENISFIGYEMAMQRLLGARPIIEIEYPDESQGRQAGMAAAPSVAPTARSNTG